MRAYSSSCRDLQLNLHPPLLRLSHGFLLHRLVAFLACLFFPTVILRSVRFRGTNVLLRFYNSFYAATHHAAPLTLLLIWYTLSLQYHIVPSNSILISQPSRRTSGLSACQELEGCLESEGP